MTAPSRRAAVASGHYLAIVGTGCVQSCQATGPVDETGSSRCRPTPVGSGQKGKDLTRESTSKCTMCFFIDIANSGSQKKGQWGPLSPSTQQRIVQMLGET